MRRERDRRKFARWSRTISPTRTDFGLEGVIIHNIQDKNIVDQWWPAYARIRFTLELYQARDHLVYKEPDRGRTSQCNVCTVCTIKQAQKFNFLHYIMNNSIIYYKCRTYSYVDGVLVVKWGGGDHFDRRFLHVVSQIRATIVTKMVWTWISARSPRRDSLARCEMMVAHLDAATLEACKCQSQHIIKPVHMLQDR